LLSNGHADNVWTDAANGKTVQAQKDIFSHQITTIVGIIAKL